MAYQEDRRNWVSLEAHRELLLNRDHTITRLVGILERILDQASYPRHGRADDHDLLTYIFERCEMGIEIAEAGWKEE